MQVLVLRQVPEDSSVFGFIEPENSGGQGPSALVAHVRSRLEEIIQRAEQRGTLIVRCGGHEGEVAWMPGPQGVFARWIEELEAAWGGGLCVWPTAAGAVSDVPSLRRFLARGDERGREWSFLFDPAAMLTPEMRAKEEDHRARWQEELGEHPRRWGTLLAGGLVEPGPAWG